MAFSPKSRKVPKARIKEQVLDAARILELEPYLDRKPRELSGGQRQRVAMGRAIVRHPHAFLMDEPLSNLDAKLRVQMRVEIADIQRALGVTTIYVTHDQTEAMPLGDRVAVIERGVLQQVATPQELYARPANLVVAGFIGSPAMNLIEAKLERTDSEGAVVVFGDHKLPVGAETFSENPKLEGYVGKDVVLGIRPESIEDTAFVTGAARRAELDVTITLREELGSEVDVHFEMGVPKLTVVELQAGDPAASDGDVVTTSLSPTFAARLDHRTAFKEGERAKVFVDLTSMHFFDPQTRERIEAPA
jgi:multiple sugar transport system ATP-binding protein